MIELSTLLILTYVAIQCIYLAKKEWICLEVDQGNLQLKINKYKAAWALSSFHFGPYHSVDAHNNTLTYQAGNEKH